ncbi:MAG: SDR family oxidoreductase [Nitrososphaerota archaeon]|nr:SDR family oxidoreductase [Nitrososphaerota archaeon]
MKFDGKTVIVTGGAKGIGRVYSAAFAERGASVCVADIDEGALRQTSEEIGKLGGRCHCVRTDVSDPDSVEKMVRSCDSSLGPPDVLVNNAAYFSTIARRPWNEVPADEWRKALDVNVVGMWLCCRAAFPYMKQRGRGKIVNISSGTALGSPSPGFIHYVTSKGAVISFTRALAREVGEYNVNVNTVTPGLVATEATVANYPKDTFLRSRERRCLKRDLVPADLVGAVLFLASEESDFVTGQIINVDGGSIMV